MDIERLNYNRLIGSVVCSAIAGIVVAGTYFETRGIAPTGWEYALVYGGTICVGLLLMGLTALLHPTFYMRNK